MWATCCNYKSDPVAWSGATGCQSCSRDNCLTFPFINEGGGTAFLWMETWIWTVSVWSRSRMHAEMGLWWLILREIYPLCSSFSLWKSTKVKKEMRTAAGKKQTCRIARVWCNSPLSLAPSVNQPIAQISQLTGFDELLQPVHQADWGRSALADCTVRHLKDQKIECSNSTELLF